MKILEIAGVVIWGMVYIAAILCVVAKNGRPRAQEGVFQPILYNIFPYIWVFIPIGDVKTRSSFLEAAGLVCVAFIVTWALIFTTKKQWDNR